MSKLIRRQIGEGVHFSHIIDPKFKHNRIAINFIVPLDQERVTANAIVPFLLRKGCKAYPDFTELNRRLSDLYGASLDADVSKFGGFQIISVSITGVDDRYTIGGEAVTGACAALIGEIALRPNIVNGAFPAADVELERQYLIDTIESEINDKRTYALSRCKALMCKEEPYAIKRYGYTDKAKDITPQMAAEAYTQLRDGARVEILFIGSGHEEAAYSTFVELFHGLKRQVSPAPPIPRIEKAERLQSHEEQMDVNQSKLVMGFRTGPDEQKDANGVMRMTAALYGGTPFSRLFVNVREKLSLCYYCAARYDLATGLLMVDSGVEAENKEKAYEEILNQLTVLQKGEFSDDELRFTKLALGGALRATEDSLGGMESWYTTRIMVGDALAPPEDAALMDKVTKEQVVRAAGQITLDTVYFLTGKGGESRHD